VYVFRAESEISARARFEELDPSAPSTSPRAPQNPPEGSQTVLSHTLARVWEGTRPITGPCRDAATRAARSRWNKRSWSSASAMHACWST